MSLQLFITCLAAVVRKISVIASKKPDFLLHENIILSIHTNARLAIILHKMGIKRPFSLENGLILTYYLRGNFIFACATVCIRGSTTF